MIRIYKSKSISSRWLPQIPWRQAAKDRGIKWPQLDVASARHGPHNRQAIFPGCQHPGFVWKYLRNHRPKPETPTPWDILGHGDLQTARVTWPKLL